MGKNWGGEGNSTQFQQFSVFQARNAGFAHRCVCMRGGGDFTIMYPCNIIFTVLLNKKKLLHGKKYYSVATSLKSFVKNVQNWEGVSFLSYFFSTRS